MAVAATYRIGWKARRDSFRHKLLRKLSRRAHNFRVLLATRDSAVARVTLRRRFETGPRDLGTERLLRGSIDERVEFRSESVRRHAWPKMRAFFRPDSGHDNSSAAGRGDRANFWRSGNDVLLKYTHREHRVIRWRVMIIITEHKVRKFFFRRDPG